MVSHPYNSAALPRSLWCVEMLVCFAWLVAASRGLLATAWLSCLGYVVIGASFQSAAIVFCVCHSSWLLIWVFAELFPRTGDVCNVHGQHWSVLSSSCFHQTAVRLSPSGHCCHWDCTAVPLCMLTVNWWMRRSAWCTAAHSERDHLVLGEVWRQLYSGYYWLIRLLGT